ncbi:MAG: flagellar protein FlgN [Gammaproteobacteria bacterium]|nr:flagellar protein FlgN [Gammaproteobacteria bacterium]
MNNPSPEACHTELMTLLVHQKEELDAINTYLDEIKSAIVENDAESLNTLITQQRLPIAEMDDLEKQRNCLLETYGFKANRDGLLSCIAWCDKDEAITRQYELFRQALLHLQRSIQVNSLLVSKGRERVRQSLQLIMGQPTSEQVTTYSSRGKAEDNCNHRTIAQA